MSNGARLSLDEFAEQLKTHRNIKAVLTQACETSTGTAHPISEMSAAVRKHSPQALFAVDAITGVGCFPLPMDDWGIDVMIAGSQKAFMIPHRFKFYRALGKGMEGASSFPGGKILFRPCR